MRNEDQIEVAKDVRVIVIVRSQEFSAAKSHVTANRQARASYSLMARRTVLLGCRSRWVETRQSNEIHGMGEDRQLAPSQPKQAPHREEKQHQPAAGEEIPTPIGNIRDIA
jgi:hypothetical protein